MCAMPHAHAPGGRGGGSKVKMRFCAAFAIACSDDVACGSGEALKINPFMSSRDKREFCIVSFPDVDL